MNWQHILLKLKERGLSQQAIADYCGCSQSSIAELGLGRVTEPKYRVGMGMRKLLGLNEIALLKAKAGLTKYEPKDSVL